MPLLETPAPALELRARQDHGRFDDVRCGALSQPVTTGRCDVARKIGKQANNSRRLPTRRRALGCFHGRAARASGGVTSLWPHRDRHRTASRYPPPLLGHAERIVSVETRWARKAGRGGHGAIPPPRPPLAADAGRGALASLAALGAVSSPFFLLYPQCFARIQPRPGRRAPSKARPVGEASSRRARLHYSGTTVTARHATHSERCDNSWASSGWLVSTPPPQRSDPECGHVESWMRGFLRLSEGKGTWWLLGEAPPKRGAHCRDPPRRHQARRVVPSAGPGGVSAPRVESRQDGNFRRRLPRHWQAPAGRAQQHSACLVGGRLTTPLLTHHEQ